MPTPGIRPLVAGNWKMNGLRRSMDTVEALKARVEGGTLEHVEMLICPPATLVALTVKAMDTASIHVGGQTCHPNESGAHTGDISAEMLLDVGADFVLVGHSERRTDHGESDGDVHAQTLAAWRAGLCAVVCVGETKDERQSGQEIDVVARQLAGSVPDGATAQNTVIAYEPVWAIGTGLTPTVADIDAMHAVIRNVLTERFGDEGAAMRLLYGGSVKPSNAAEVLSPLNVDGALVGGASLSASDFADIADAVATLVSAGA